MGIKSALKNRIHFANWMLLGKERYRSEAFLRRPSPSSDAQLDRFKNDFYENGVAVVDGFKMSRPVESVLADLKKEFAPAIEKFNASLPEGKQMHYVDAEGRKWYVNAQEGLIQCQYDDPTHPLYAQINGEEKARQQKEKNVQTIATLFNRFPVFKEAVDTPHVVAINDYANGGYRQPLTIKLERKIKTLGEGYNQIHFDTYLSSVKAYLYLTDVDKERGAFAYSPGSHHWKLYPQMLHEIMGWQRKLFTEEDLGRYQIKPFSYASFPAGTLFSFTGNIIHSATDVTKDERWTVQYYYNTTHKWSTDQERRG